MGSQWNVDNDNQEQRTYVEPMWSRVMGRTLVFLAAVFAVLVFCRLVFQLVTGK